MQQRFLGTKTETEQKENAESDEKEEEEKEKEKEKKKKEKKTRKSRPSVRLRPISTSASWPKSNWPKSNWPKSSILVTSCLSVWRSTSRCQARSAPRCLWRQSTWKCHCLASCRTCHRKVFVVVRWQAYGDTSSLQDRTTDGGTTSRHHRWSTRWAVQFPETLLCGTMVLSTTLRGGTRLFATRPQRRTSEVSPFASGFVRETWLACHATAVERDTRVPTIDLALDLCEALPCCTVGVCSGTSKSKPEQFLTTRESLLGSGRPGALPSGNSSRKSSEETNLDH